MKPNEYQKLCLRTANSGHDMTKMHCFANWSMGIVGEIGEFIEATNEEDELKEIGDLFWYAAVMASDANLQFDLVLDEAHKKFIIKKREYVRDKVKVLEKSAWYLDEWKKMCCHGHGIDSEKVWFQLSDLISDCMVLVEPKMNFKLYSEDIMEKNIEKLKARYPDGFSTEASLNRADG